MDKRARELIEIGDAERGKRRPLDSLWQELADNFYPFRADFTQKRVLGDEFVSHLSDSYPVMARQELGNNFSTMLRNRRLKWFAPSSGDDDRDQDPVIAQGLEYIGQVVKRGMYDPKARFSRATKESDQDYAAFGQCVISVEESPYKDSLLYRNWHLRDCVWMDDECGATNRMDRQFMSSARNYAARWHKKMPQAVKDNLKKDPSKESKLRHIVMPRDEYDLNKTDAEKRSKSNPFVSIYIDVENEIILSEGSLPRFNYVVPRWQTVNDWQYAFSPSAIIALPDARMVQAMARTIQEAAEYAVDPAWKVTGEAINSEFNVFPGGIIDVDRGYDEKTGSAFEAIQRGGDVRLGVEEKQDSRDMIAQAFLLNKLQLPPAADGSMTATEVMQRVEEYVRAALPLFEPIETEYNAPLVELTFEMLSERNAFDIERIPQELRGSDFEFKFLSPLQEAEDRKRVTQFQETVGLISGVAGIDPQAAAKAGAKIDLDKALTEAIRGTGAPADWIKSDEDAAEAQAEMQEQMEGQQALNQAEQIAGMAPNITQATTDLANVGLVA